MRTNILILALACVVVVYQGGMTAGQTYWSMLSLLLVSMFSDWWRKGKVIDKLENRVHWLQMRNTELSAEVTASAARAEKYEREAINLRFMASKNATAAHQESFTQLQGRGNRKAAAHTSDPQDQYRGSSPAVYDNAIEFSHTEVTPPSTRAYEGGGSFGGGGASATWDSHSSHSSSGSSSSSSGSDSCSSDSSSSSSSSGCD